MAYINLAGGLKINTADAVDSRLVLTKAEMKSLHYANDESRPATLRGKIFQLPSNYLCICSEDNTIYVYNALNEEDELTGKFKKVESGGGDIWLDIAPYLSEDETSISQEGYDLVWNSFSNETENPSNKYAGILYNNYKAYLNKTIMGDKAGIVFKAAISLDTETIEFVITIYNDKSVVVSQKFDSSSPVWYDLSTSSVTAIGQEQYDDIKALADSNKLAGIIVAGGIYPLTFRLEGTFLFSTTCIVGQTLERKIQQNECTIKSDLSITTNLKEYPYIERLIGLSRQVIPSIKTDGYQENLSIGDGLVIENGALKTTGGGQSIKDLPVVELTSETTTVTDETVKAKILENVNKDNYLICKLKMGSIEILITRDSKIVPDDTFENTVFTQSVFINLGIVAPTFVFTLSINSKDNTIAVEYETLGYVKDNKVSLVLKPNESFGVTTDYGDTNLVNGLELYFDTINGKPIIHSDNTVNSYDIPTITFED